MPSVALTTEKDSKSAFNAAYGKHMGAYFDKWDCRITAAGRSVAVSATEEEISAWGKAVVHPEAVQAYLGKWNDLANDINEGIRDADLDQGGHGSDDELEIISGVDDDSDEVDDDDFIVEIMDEDEEDNEDEDEDEEEEEDEE
jgi:hypothetical protein